MDEARDAPEDLAPGAPPAARSPGCHRGFPCVPGGHPPDDGRALYLGAVARLLTAIARLLGLRRQELVRALPVATAYALILGSLYVLKPARNALFLGRFGAGHLPYALILVALVGGAALSLSPRSSRPGRAQRVFAVLLPVLALNLLGFWAVLGFRNSDVATYAFFVWVNLYGLVATSLLWIIANSVFDAREARRVFGFIGAGGILGAICGGAFTELAVRTIGTLSLLWVCAGMMVAAAALAQVPRPLEDPASQSRREVESGAGGLWSTPLVRWVAPMVGLAAVASALVDLQFNAVVDAAFPTTDAKAAYFGRFFAVLNACAFLFQLFLTPRILRRLGVGSALFVLPALLGLGSAALVFAPVLAVALIPKGIDAGLRHSLHKAATEILYLPLPTAIKPRVKLFLDATVDNVGTGVGALLALLLTGVLSLHFRYLGVAALGVVALWLGVTLGVRSAYLEAFRQALARRRLDPRALRVELSDAATVNSLLGALASDNAQKVAYALEMLAHVESAAVVAQTVPLLEHPVAEVRVKALQALEVQPGAAALERVDALVHADAHPAVRRAALHYVCVHAGDGRAARLRGYLTAADDAVVVAALGCAAESWPQEAAQQLTEEYVTSVLARSSPHAPALRRELLRLLGGASDPTLRALRARLEADASPEVLAVAIEAAGRARATERIPWLIAQLGDRRVRLQARVALASFGGDVLPALRAAYGDPGTPPAVKARIPRVLARIPEQAAVDLLIELAGGARFRERRELYRALNKLRERGLSLHFDPARLLPLLADEVAWHVGLVELSRHAIAPATPAAKLLWRALGEKQKEAVERAFRVLGLLYPPKDIYAAYLGIVSGHRLVKANAIEFLDNLLERDVRRKIVPMLEAEQSSRIEAARGGSWLLPLLRAKDAWLRACAVYNADVGLSAALRDEVTRAQRDDDPVVRETAKLVLERGGAAPC